MKKILSLALLYALLTANYAHATSSATATNTDPNVHLNADSLLTLLLQNNSSVLMAFSQVRQAKLNVDSALNKTIFPQITAGLNINSLFNPASAPSFALSSVSILLPFLVPSNWFNLSAEGHLLNAQGYAYYIAELNAYASAYSLYVEIIGNKRLRAELEEVYETYENIAKDNYQGSRMFGDVDPVVVLESQAQAESALGDVQAADELIAQETVQLRQALGLGLDKVLVFDEVDSLAIQSTPWETESLQELADKAFAVSPEAAQMQELISSAKNATQWSEVFAFLGGASLNAGVNGGPGNSSVNLTQFNLSGNATLGLDTFPAVQLTNENIIQYKLQLQALTQAESATVESAMISITAALAQYQNKLEAEQHWKAAYQAALQGYTITGQTTYQQLLSAEQGATAAASARVKSLFDVYQQRTNLNRIMLSDVFAQIPPCKLAAAKPENFFTWIGDLFGVNPNHVTLDAACNTPSLPSAN